MIPFSVLDLAPIVEGSDAADAFRRSLDLARHAERYGYKRFWLAEHHGIPGIASAATAVVIAHVAAGTSTIRVGAGGIMLPNHSPLVIAEQFGTLASLYSGRIDLGVGRAPGSDQVVAQALRRDPRAGDEFPRDVVELMSYFAPPQPGQLVRAVPGAGLEVPIWILGSSLFGAQVAAALGLPFAFASHFAPAHMDQAIAIYRERFEPSGGLARPHVMLAVNAFAAESDEEGRRLLTSLQQAFIHLRRGMPTLLQPPNDSFPATLLPYERAMLDELLTCTVVGSPETVRRWLEAFIARTRADELIVTGQIFDHSARLRSFEIVAEVAGLRSSLNPSSTRVDAAAGEP
ncbi:MAG: LLM class flavin-dependent oxidoreductase [Gemmatimonadaceae bacterium]